MKETQLTWSSAIEVGVADIDAQHKQLFDLAATFRDAGDQVRVMKSLVALCDYANTHLHEEEALLTRIGYAKLAEHKVHHAQFRKMLRQLLEDARTMNLDQIAVRVEELINGWFYQHIIKVDAEYVPAIRAFEALADH